MKRSMMRSKNRTGGLALAALLAAAAGCGGGDTRNRAAIRGRDTTASVGGGGQATATKKIDPATAGTIAGVVKWDGTKPKREEIDVSGNPDCAKAVKETVYKENLVVNDDGTVCNVFVSIDTNDVYDPPTEPFVVDQSGCRYVPHAFIVMAGQTVKVKNSDSTLHNVHYIPTGEVNQEDNFAMAGVGVRERKFTAADWIKFKCEVHPWMGAWAWVRTHPFFAVTGKDGKYTIANVPAGTHKLVLKHEMLGEQSVTVTVETGKTATQDFTLKK
jgi:plastocyanin